MGLRALLVLVALLALVGVTDAAAQPPADAPAQADAASAEPQYQILHTPDVEADSVARSADEILAEERRKTYVRRAPQAKAPPATEINLAQTMRPIPTPAIKFQTFMAEDQRRAVLQGRSGPFIQAATAWSDRDWFALLWAMATLGVWLLGSGLVIWLGYSAVQAFNRH